VSLAVPPSTRDRITPEAVGAPDARNVYLNVEDIEAESNPGVVYGVFINLPPHADAAERDRHHVGNITVFGAEAVKLPDRPHDMVPGFRHTFDITPFVAAARRSGQWNPDDLQVTFEPVLPVAPVGVPTPEAATAAANPLRIGRVSLFVG
jgi:tyrosinase